MDLDGWEKKVLLFIIVIVLLIGVYAFNPFRPASNNTTPTQTVKSTDTPIPFNVVTNNNSGNNTTGNNTYKITPDQAKNIALQANPGYTASTPLQGSIVINGTSVTVYIVTLTKSGEASKTVYVDVNTGNIISTS
jgi:uncharacterized membrane protein YkoI